jgi:hypothetical protein
VTRANTTVLLVLACVAAVSGQGKPAIHEPPDLAGTWKLNRELSQSSTDVGFGMDMVGGGESGAGERGGVDAGGFGAGPARASRPSSREEAENSRQLVNEVRNPPARLTVVQDAGAVTITDDRHRSRTFRPDGRQEWQPLDAGPVATVSKWDGVRLLIRYEAEPGREVRYTYSRTLAPPRLVVQAELLERGGHHTVKQVYEPAGPDEPVAVPPSPERSGQAAPPVLTLPSQRPGASQNPPVAAEPVRPLAPAVPASAAPPDLDQRPDAELKGLSSLGVVVEDLGPEALACGLRQNALTAAVSKSLTAAGLNVVQNSDEDTYLYVHVITIASQTGRCFSRYDAYLYSNTAARLSFGTRPVLVQVSLLHEGGVASGGVGTHGEMVTRAIAQYVDRIAARVRNANR